MPAGRQAPGQPEADAVRAPSHDAGTRAGPADPHGDPRPAVEPHPQAQDAVVAQPRGEHLEHRRRAERPRELDDALGGAEVRHAEVAARAHARVPAAEGDAVADAHPDRPAGDREAALVGPDHVGGEVVAGDGVAGHEADDDGAVGAGLR